MNEYWGIVTALLALASLFALWSFMRPIPASLQEPDSHRADNISLFQQQQADLQAELAAGNLNEAEYSARTVELERTLYDDLKDQKSRPNLNNRGAWLVLLTALLIPVSGWFTYAELGAIEGVQQRENMLSTRALMQNSQSMAQLSADLQASLQDKPN
ncbi:MAG: c-type cytochrome biogenesis protein CcmI, partial [Gammaproteobacteria bacterium]|nr:c-type cytochrome biogenesis protein CcmI [Gammaproteobacteria bacterium]